MILGVTPVRGGSKGIPKKNIRPLNGKPLLAWTIEAAKSSKLLGDYVVSTEDSDIAKVANDWGARVVKRPLELALDAIITLPVLQHVLEEEQADILVLLQATSPIRDPGLIDRCIQQYLDTKPDSLATGFICHEMEYGSLFLPRQGVTGFFCDDGNVYVIDADLLRSGERYGDKRDQVLVDREQNLDINDEFDFWLAGQILKRRTETNIDRGSLPNN